MPLGLRLANSKLAAVLAALATSLLISPFAAGQTLKFQPANLASESAGQPGASAQAPATQRTAPQAEPAVVSPSSTISKPFVTGPPSVMEGASTGLSASKNQTKGKLDAMLQKFNPARIITDAKFKRAAAAFPEFCRQWGAKLVERTQNNLRHIEWKLQNGYETGDYVSYGGIQTCTAKQTPKGVPLGKLTYQEFDYLLAGKTVDEAARSAPRLLSITNTTEIFRWGRNRWVY